MKKVFACITAACLSLSLMGCGGTDAPVDSVKNVEKKEVERKITISCAGDCTLGTDSAFGGVTFPVEVENQNGDMGYFLKNVKPYFENDDLTIVNFEGTLTERGTRQDKTFAFKGNPKYTQVLTEGSVEAVTLANNHSRDYGDVSFDDTKKYIEEAGIVWFENLNTKVIDVKGVKVGLVGLYALNGTAEDNLPKAMEQVKSDGAELIVLQVHWGIEGDNYPQDSQVNLAHNAIDMGADLVIGHHPHVLQGMEVYKDRVIAYSLGNFCFGGNQNPRDKDTMIYQQTFTVKDGKVSDYSDWAIVPASLSSVSSRNNYQPTPAKGSEKTRIADKIQKFSDKLGDITVKVDGEDYTATDNNETTSKKSEADSDKKSGSSSSNKSTKDYDERLDDEPIEDEDTIIL